MIEPSDGTKAFEQWFATVPGSDSYPVSIKIEMQLAFIQGAMWMNDCNSQNVLKIIREELQCSKK